MDESNIEHRIFDVLQRRMYSPNTIEQYQMWATRIMRHYSDTPLEDISQEQIKLYLQFLTDKKNRAPSTVHQAAHALHTVYNDVLGVNYDIKSISLPQRDWSPEQEILTPHEIMLLLEHARDLKRKAIYGTAYSAGLFVSELRRLRVKDVDFENMRLYVRNKQGHIVRHAILSGYLAEDLKRYISEQDLDKWLFEGRNPDSPYSSSAIQKAFKQDARNAGITKKVTPKSLRYSYVKHLTDQGVPLVGVLNTLGLATSLTSRTFKFYHKLIYGVDHASVDHSPLDRIVHEPDPPANTGALKRILFLVKNEQEKDYLSEAVLCLEAGANRASVVLAWSAAIRNVQSRCLKHSSHALNSALRAHWPNAPNVQKIEDFAYIKDRTILLTAQNLGEFDKNEKDVLIQCLNLRNKCGHPGNYKPRPHKVAAFIEDLITIIFQSQ